MLFTILLGVTLREYGIYEPSHGRKKSTKFSCCFSISSLPSTIPWACGRQTIHHHALSHSQAIDIEWDNDHHNPEPGNAWNRVLRGIHRKPEGVLSEDELLPKSEVPRSHSVTQSCKQTPLPFSWGLLSMSHFLKATLRAVHWKTGQRPGQVPEAQRISLASSVTCRWHCRCLLPDQTFVNVSFRWGQLNFRSFTFLPLANNFTYSFDKGLTRFVMSLPHWIMFIKGTFPEVSFEDKNKLKRRERIFLPYCFADKRQEKKKKVHRRFAFLGSIKAYLQHFIVQHKFISYVINYNTINITCGCFMSVEKILIKRLMLLRWNWHDKALESTYCRFLLLSILANIIDSPFPPNDADLKSLVCIAQIVTRVHGPLDMDTQEQAKTWSRRAFSLFVWSYYYHSMSVCSTKIEHFHMCHTLSYTLT